MAEKKYKIAIIGGGPGGYTAALRAGQLGADTVLIEKEALGGTCLNWGCIPTKSFVRSAEVFADIKNAADYGIKVENAELDFPAVVKRKDKIVKRLVRGIDHLLKKSGIDRIDGLASFIDQNTIRIEKDTEIFEIKAENIIIATGSKAASLPISGAGLEGILDSRAALDLEKLPESMVIVGGGIIGMEFAFIFRNFGVDVTVIEYLDQLINGVDTEIAAELNRSARRRRISVKTSAEVKEIKKLDAGYEVVYQQKEKKKSAKAEKVLMAVGRRPYTDGLQLENVGIETISERNAVQVNNKMETNIEGIYAIGDVTDKILLAHVASHQGVVAVENIMGMNKKMNYKAVPGAIFTSPEVGTVGLSEKEAKAKGIDYEIGSFPFAASGKVMAMGEREGKIKLITEKDKGRIIGAAIIGIEASDLIAELTLAVNLGLTAENLRETIHAHPTTAEVVHEAALDLGEGSLNA
ncbi:MULTISPECIES: dihydrolipoyl dehydrogenase [Halanaerobium]|jgi:dihydrolipoamide dehydrogenase|uniref:Dihydrolipoyl dehydrogenase n=1 Tax=Halanaerobium kushneri TaxID=56779 RepID=A0A1N6TPC4_9FIRM|nr:MULTISPECIES: dihydrolipoyl dehydrogenase [Halanaerobium]RCW56271.1 dihydrolipoamide dehydrogenase [Halanaerobium sp. ST460_2HS_T2]SIQ55199.1 dihydrolipoamide dehydrogenase [Halanaerobium kushneri]